MHYRERGDDPPHYVLYPGEDCGYFSVEAVHNGVFCGLRANLDYVSGTSSFFDNLTVDTWSISWINEILRILGHERDERTSVYWLLPGKDITDGLVLIEKQSHIRDMINANGDDDLFADNVDKSVNDYNEKELCQENEDEDVLEDDDLNFEGENRQHLMVNIKAFNLEVDMDNPTFKIGMLFSGVEELRKAVTTYAIRNRFKIKKLRNERRRFEVVCAPGCNWMLKASRRSGGFIVTTYDGTHNCEGSFPVSAITAKVLTEKFMYEFRDNQKLDPKSFAAKVLREFKMCPERWKLSRARKAAFL
ncbi:hypothetical protein ACQ4PT_056816 [Festuca glaucescens]